MKKKLLLVTLLTLSLFIFSGYKKKKETKSNSKEKITITDKELGYSVSFEYEKEDGFEFDKEETGGKYAEIKFNNKKENLKFDAYYTESTKITSDALKVSRKNKKYYKEYKYDKYNAYDYNDYDDELYLVISVGEKENYVQEIFVSIEKDNYKEKEIVYDMFNKDVIQKFFKSIKVTVE